MSKQHSTVFKSADELILKGIIPTAELVGARHPELGLEEIEPALAAWFRHVGSVAQALVSPPVAS